VFPVFHAFLLVGATLLVQWAARQVKDHPPLTWLVCVAFTLLMEKGLVPHIRRIWDKGVFWLSVWYYARGVPVHPTLHNQ